MAVLFGDTFGDKTVYRTAMNEFEHDGVWWLPEQPDQKVSGRLEHTQQSGLRLELHGAFGNRIREIADRRVEHDIIHGLTDGRAVTLEDAHHGLVNSFRQPYFVKTAYIGGHFAKSPMFASWTIRLTHLDNFLGINPTFVLLGQIGQVVSASPLGEIVSDDVTLRFVQTHGAAEPTETGRSHIVAELSSPVTVAAMLRRVAYPVQNLVTLATLDPAIITEVTARDAPSGDDVSLVFLQRKSEERRDLIPDDMLFSRHDLIDFETVASTWLASHDQLREIFALFYGLHFRRGDITSAIVHVVECLEAFHRETRMPPTERIPKADHAELRAEFKKVLNAKFSGSKLHSEWFSDVLGNWPTLAARLTALLDAEREVIGSLFPDEEATKNDAKKYRNTFAHGLPLEPLPPREMEYLYWLTEQLTLLLCSCLMSWTGIPRETRRAVFGRSRWFARVRDNIMRLTPVKQP